MKDFFQRLVHRHLQTLRGGRLTMIAPSGSTTFGSGGELEARIQVHRPRFYRRTVLGGGLGFAESYLDGDWTCDDLTSVLRILVRNLSVADELERKGAWLTQRVAAVRNWFRRNTRRGSARNIREHYDLSNVFFQLFLDETMSYSSGVFEHPQATMYAASLAKMERIGRKLNLQPEDSLLEIGSGWGGLAIYVARKFGCRVTTTTISTAQYKLARERIAAAGVSDRVTVLLRDYRDLTGQFDKLVSVEMVEAVGHQYLGTYFRQCSRLLKPDGMMLLQGIVMCDQGYRQYLRNVDFIRRHVFPGGCLPSIASLHEATAQHSDFRTLHLEDIGPHYPPTLRCWREEFLANQDEVRRLGFSDRFIRLWEYYLCYCEAGFEERRVNNVQMLLAKPACRLDPVTIRLGELRSPEVAV